MNSPSFLVRVASQSHVDFSLRSPFGGGPAGRCKRKKLKAASKPAEKEAEEGEDAAEEAES